VEFSTHLDLPVPGSGCGDIRVRYFGLSLRVEFEYHLDGKDLIGELRFEGVLAFRFRDEMHSAGFPTGSYDCVMSSRKTDWLRELAAAEPSGVKATSEATHFAVLFSSNGLLEVIARTVSLGEDRAGLLEVAE
jgi:hypothetical protein